VEKLIFIVVPPVLHILYRYDIIALNEWQALSLLKKPVSRCLRRDGGRLGERAPCAVIGEVKGNPRT
jgi:hypothetical protein